MHKKIPGSYAKREGGNPGNSGLSSQQYYPSQQHYPRTVWKNSYAEHEVTGKHTINLFAQSNENSYSCEVMNIFL